MRWGELTKEQKQYVFLAGLVTGGILFGVFTGIKHGITTLRNVSHEAKELEKKIEDARIKMSRLPAMKQTLSDLREQFGKTEKMIPPRDERFSRVTSFVHRHARSAAVEIASVDPLVTPGLNRGKNGGDDAEHPLLVPYGVRIIARAGYHGLVDWLALMQDENPLVRCSVLEIKNADDPVHHSIRLELQWAVPPEREKS
ncbi:hypothetical protein [Kiritimatiella glycovorans]|uniref:Pilus assembly protein, PilO n=1 Tax=Kiritimatiella glycovorans TaxID=1307763 RepID=A0A0G3EFI4_9BACT|nr:hypothetical protein [Kiritimatiella glycovorans]AKJ63560.1 hypothetical protein L21SP4_00279 [Kiritimatiella glycovorans]